MNTKGVKWIFLPPFLSKKMDKREIRLGFFTLLTIPFKKKLLVMSSLHENIALLILAAGSSSRMGSSKQGLDLGAENLLQHTIRVALEANPNPPFVVLGANKIFHQSLIKGYQAKIIEHDEWALGMGSSLKAGLQSILEERKDWESILVLVCDQPLLSSNHLNLLIHKSQMSEALIICSRYMNQLGVPALFRAALFPEILGIENQEGAKKIILQHLEATEALDFPEGALDLDTPEDYRRYLQGKPKK